MPMHASRGRPRLEAELRQALPLLGYARRRVRFLLGSDEDIDHETRVALVPRHVEALGEALGEAGLELEVLVASGAGDRAGFRDAEYAAAGARVVGRDEIARLGPVDVLHALKEPTACESEVPGPLLRIGALHLASYPPGLCRMLARRNFAAIFDGGTVGSCSYLLDGGDRTPIVASMSRFAGSVAGRKLVEGLTEKGLGAGKVVVVGGGVAGLAAIGEIGPKTAKLVVIERYPPTRERLPGLLRAHGFRDFEIVPDLTDEALRDAVGVIFAHRSGAKAAEKVCTFDQIRLMRTGAAVVDIAIDQGGSIRHDGYCEDDNAAASRDKYRALLRDYYYFSETNMPRAVPREASEVHGDASWVYVASLLALTALHGGPCEATREILRHQVRALGTADGVGGRDLVGCLVQDLRNGLQIAAGEAGVRIEDPEVRNNDVLAHWVHACAQG
jgi:alanine dehydrogenase